MNSHIGESSHDLLLGSELGALLKFEVTNSSRKGKVAIDTTKIDKAASGTDTGFFAWMELVIWRGRRYYLECSSTNLHFEACGQTRAA